MSHVVVMAAGAALVSGAAQAIVVFVRREIFHQLTFTSGDVVWMAPMANLVLIAPLAAVAAIATRFLPFRFAAIAAAWVFACYAGYTTLLLFPGLAPYAMVLLTIGAAARFAQVVGRAPERWFPRLRRFTIGLAAVLGIAAIAIASVRAARERSAMAALQAPPVNAPNVLLLVLDTVRASSMSLHGYERSTSPEIDRLATEGVMFDWAFATTSWTLPSHGSMFTGRRPDEMSARLITPLDEMHPTLAEVFRDRGYATGGFVANYTFATRESGLARGFIHYEDSHRPFLEAMLTPTLVRTNSFRDAFRSVLWDRSPRGAVKTLLTFRFTANNRRTALNPKPAAVVNAEFLQWQASLGSRPFFAFLNYFDAHDPYQPPPPFDRKFGPRLRDRYEGGIAYIDHELTSLLAELRRRGVLDRTILVITSDHGEQFGEHGKRNHTNSLYIQATHVPLVMRYPPSIPRGIRVNRAVTLQDLPATIVDLADIPGGARMAGVSLGPLASGESESGASPIVLELEEHLDVMRDIESPEIRALVDDSYHYITSGGATDQLYAYRVDKEETNDLARTRTGEEAVERLRAELKRVTSPAPYRMRTP
jgi:arylsulfatase A-like enzyme